jgi:hypothetical protein
MVVPCKAVFNSFTTAWVSAPFKKWTVRCPVTITNGNLNAKCKDT